jgi:hypothetical protein
MRWISSSSVLIVFENRDLELYCLIALNLRNQKGVSYWMSVLFRPSLVRDFKRSCDYQNVTSSCSHWSRRRMTNTLTSYFSLYTSWSFTLVVRTSSLKSSSIEEFGIICNQYKRGSLLLAGSWKTSTRYRIVILRKIRLGNRQVNLVFLTWYVFSGRLRQLAPISIDYIVESDVAIGCISSPRSNSVYWAESKECWIYRIKRIDKIECFT